MLQVWIVAPDGRAQPAPPPPDPGRWAEAACVWVDVEDGSGEEFAWLQRTFRLHPLEIEDARTPGEAPKLEEHEDHAFLVTEQPLLRPAGEGLPALERVQLDLFWGERFLITVHPVPLEPVSRLRRRLERGGLPGTGGDFLAHAVLDRLVDELLPLAEQLEQLRERVEEELLAGPAEERLSLRLTALRRLLQRARDAAGPLALALERLSRPGAPFVSEAARPYFRDACDHAQRALRWLEQEQAVLAGAYEIYLARLSHALALAAQRSNEVMKQLTLVTSLFLPLSFIAGVYGMNFRHMPELAWPWGYPFALGLMGLTAAAMLAYYRRKGWL
jgi:magnesium transporter